MPTELTVSPAGDATLLSLLRQDGTLLESPCNGKGLCGKCKVHISQDRSVPLRKVSGGSLLLMN